MASNIIDVRYTYGKGSQAYTHREELVTVFHMCPSVGMFGHVHPQYFVKFEDGVCAQYPAWLMKIINKLDPGEA